MFIHTHGSVQLSVIKLLCFFQCYRTFVQCSFIAMSFSLDNPGFSTIGEDLANASLDNASQPLSGFFSSTPSSGEYTRRSCPRCHGRMSSFSVDRRSICTKRRGSDCNLDCRCDECLSWSVEEMESYVRLCKSLASKGKKKASSSVKTPSAPGPPAPSVDIDDKIRSHIAVFSQDVDDRLATMSSSIMTRLDDLFVRFNEKFSNRSLSAEPRVSGLMPPTGQSLPLHHSVSTHVNPMRFQSDVGGPMPQSSGSAHPNIGESHLGSGVSQFRALLLQASTEALEPAQAVQFIRQHSDRLQASGDHPVFVWEPEDEDEND